MTEAPLRLLDTTLRDGSAGSGFDPDGVARRAIALALEAAGIDAIELVSSDAEDIEGVQALVADLLHVETCVIGPATSDAVGKALSLLDGARLPRIHLYGDVTRDGALAPALEAIFAARVNVDRVEFSPLRVFDVEIEDVVEAAVAASDSGATTINLSDTNGRAEPEEVAMRVGRVAERVGDGCTISFHGHDHTGGAVANSLAAYRAGARQVHVCIGGVGPNGGNTRLEALIDALDASGIEPMACPGFDRMALPGLTALVGRRAT